MHCAKHLPTTRKQVRFASCVCVYVRVCACVCVRVRARAYDSNANVGKEKGAEKERANFCSLEESLEPAFGMHTS